MYKIKVVYLWARAIARLAHVAEEVLAEDHAYYIVHVAFVNRDAAVSRVQGGRQNLHHHNSDRRHSWLAMDWRDMHTQKMSNITSEAVAVSARAMISTRGCMMRLTYRNAIK